VFIVKARYAAIHKDTDTAAIHRLRDTYKINSRWNLI